MPSGISIETVSRSRFRMISRFAVSPGSYDRRIRRARDGLLGSRPSMARMTSPLRRSMPAPLGDWITRRPSSTPK